MAYGTMAGFFFNCACTVHFLASLIAVISTRGCQSFPISSFILSPATQEARTTTTTAFSHPFQPFQTKLYSSTPSSVDNNDSIKSSGVINNSDDGNTDNDSSTSSVITQATNVLSNFDSLQQQFVQADGSRGMGGGTSALTFIRTSLSPNDKQSLRNAVMVLTNEAHRQRATSEQQKYGRIMLGICAENVQEGLMGLKTWVDALALPRGLLHGMDVDGKPVDPESLGSVYLKYNTGGCMTFSEMRKSGKGFDALWKPGDVVLETYDGDFRGIYFNVELDDGVFRQFGVLPTDLFLEEEDW